MGKGVTNPLICVESEGCRRQGLSEDVTNLFLFGDALNVDGAIQDELAEVMVFESNMFSA